MEFFKTLQLCCRLLLAKKMPVKCKFNPKRLTKEEYKWVRQAKGDSRKALSMVCNKIITLTTMGKSAMVHMVGSKHQASLRTKTTANVQR